MNRKQKIKYSGTRHKCFTPCPIGIPSIHGVYAVGSSCCQYNCSAFVEINEDEKYVVCNPTIDNIKESIERLLPRSSLRLKNK